MNTLRWWKYIVFTRWPHRIGVSIIWKLPKRVVYWCVIRATVAVDHDGSPDEVTFEQMVRAVDYK